MRRLRTGDIPLILFALYAFLLLAAGFWDAWRTRGTESAAAFFVNSRTSGPWLTGISIIASCVGGSATIGMAGLAWQVGTPAFWWLGSGACGLVLLQVFLARKIRESNARTMPQMIDQWLGAGSICGITPRRLTALIIIPAWLAILAAQFTAMAGLTCALTGMTPAASMAAGAALIAAYSAMGGQRAVMRSDMPQFFILAAGLTIAFLWQCGANSQVFSQFNWQSFQLTNEAFPPSRLYYFLAVLGGSYVVCPMLSGRILSARDSSAAIRGCRIAIAGLVAFAVLAVAIGLAARGLININCPPDNVLPELMTLMPAWAAMPLLLSLLSAVLSSADSCLITAATVMCNDLFPDRKAPSASRCRVAAAVLGLLAYFLANAGHGILDLLLMANDIYVSGVVAPVFFSMLLPHRAIPPARLSLLALACGGSLGLAGSLTGDHSFVYAGMALSGGLIIFWAIYAFLLQTKASMRNCHERN